MYIGTDFDDIDAGLEARIFTIDFVAALRTGETIVSAVASVAVVSGTDAGASGRLVGSATISGTKVSQEIDLRSGPPGVYYRLMVTVSTNQEPAVSRWSHFWSRSPN